MLWERMANYIYTVLLFSPQQSGHSLSLPLSSLPKNNPVEDVNGEMYLCFQVTVIYMYFSLALFFLCC